MDRERMKELAEEQFMKRQEATTITAGEDNIIFINERSYRLVEDYREAYNQQKMAARFSDFLEKYDFLVGDIAADQLRLRGFYKDGTAGIARSNQISALQDYLYEEVNFGAPYFVLENLEPHDVPEAEEEPNTAHRKRRRQRRSTGNGGTNPNGSHHKPKPKTAAIAETTKPAPGNGKAKHVKERANTVETKGRKKRRRFQIRERQTTTEKG
ncbi:YutD family protein [Weissella sp. GP1]|uniref:YutD family protein n=1 Tax=Weissella fermenti TaxID=2987699 RepID=A0ABT6D0C2_9LACO|nr:MULTISPECIES: YutD family protein [Weissella]MBJ7688020.1 YutD family protein [Weissella confusa]MBJ7694108.1 YutD family protein [Weissella confusa]MCW0926450.1 YutD family protein [Weissella sp. LMG 11983]MDF9298873.1 YutD family protein [Weissella sp. BK2]QBZ04139.1 DUF1027 domain-containing protein [Weissella confusa]